MPAGNSATRDYLLKQSGPIGPGMGALATALAPVTGTGAPSENADFIGQVYIRTSNDKVYVATKTGTGSGDWQILN